MTVIDIVMCICSSLNMKLWKKFVIYEAEVEIQTKHVLKTLCSSRNGKYTFNVVDDFCKNHDIIHETISSYIS